jgi:glutathione peroxidase
MHDEFYEIAVTSIGGETFRMERYRGRTLLIVNVASQCGFTPQYAGLERIYRKYKDRGVVVLGFPCNQFGAQEPGDAATIERFCADTYDVTFPLFGKIKVNGDDAHPLFRVLKSSQPGVFGTEGIKWNFTKFLVDAAGAVVARYGPRDTPEAIDADIERLLLSESAT